MDSMLALVLGTCNWLLYIPFGRMEGNWLELLIPYLERQVNEGVNSRDLVSESYHISQKPNIVPGCVHRCMAVEGYDMVYGCTRVRVRSSVELSGKIFIRELSLRWDVNIWLVVTRHWTPHVTVRQP
jgi:hypothetical protein